jgi:hypothetical protein
MRVGDYSLDTYFLKNKADGAGAQVISRWSYQTRITPAVVVWIHLFHTGVNRMAGIVFIRRPHLCSFLPHRLQRAAPGDDLVEHGVD